MIPNYEKAVEAYENSLESGRENLNNLKKEIIPDLVYKETLSDEEMKKLIDHEISKGSDSLYLYNIESLTDEQARMIKENSNKFKTLFMPSLNHLTANQANLLSNIKNLDLRWMKEISDDVLKDLWKWNIEHLTLLWLERMPDNQAEILANSNIKQIEMESQVLSTKWLDILKNKLS